jgi:hypothetical protein
MKSFAMTPLDTIHKKFIQMVEANFGASFSADVIVTNIVQSSETLDSNGVHFMVKSGEFTLTCCTRLSISELQIGDKIRIKGKLMADKSLLGATYVIVDYCVRISDTIRLEKPIQNYFKLKQDLNDNSKVKLVEKIEKIHRRQIPQQINHIGIISLQSQKFILDTFKIQFQEKCKGRLSVYYVPDSIMIIGKNGEKKNKLLEGLKFFRQDKSIDMVCILIDILTIDQTLILSTGLMTKQIYSHIKNSLYTVAIIEKPINLIEDEKSVADCLSFVFLNKQYMSVYGCIEQISHIQTSYRKKITQAIQEGLESLNQISKRYEQQILNLEFDSMDLGSEYIQQKERTNIFDRLENLLMERLDSEKNKLIQMELAMAKGIANIISNSSVIKAIEIYKGIKTGELIVQQKHEVDDLVFEQDIDSDDPGKHPEENNGPPSRGLTAEKKIENKNHEVKESDLSTNPNNLSIDVNRETTL